MPTQNGVKVQELQELPLQQNGDLPVGFENMTAMAILPTDQKRTTWGKIRNWIVAAVFANPTYTALSNKVTDIVTNFHIYLGPTLTKFKASVLPSAAGRFFVKVNPTGNVEYEAYEAPVIPSETPNEADNTGDIQFTLSGALSRKFKAFVKSIDSLVDTTAGNALKKNADGKWRVDFPTNTGGGTPETANDLVDTETVSWMRRTGDTLLRQLQAHVQIPKLISMGGGQNAKGQTVDWNVIRISNDGRLFAPQHTFVDTPTVEFVVADNPNSTKEKVIKANVVGGGSSTTVLNLDSRVTLQDTILAQNGLLTKQTPNQYGNNQLGFLAIPPQYDGWRISSVSVNFASSANVAHSLEVRKYRPNNMTTGVPTDALLVTVDVQANAMSVTEQKSQIFAEKDYYLYVTGGAADVFTGSQRAASGAVLTVELENPAAVPYLPNQAPLQVVYDAINPTGQKAVSALVKAEKQTATIGLSQQILGNKKVVLFSLNDAVANIDSIELFCNQLSQSCDADGSLYIALDVAVPSATEGIKGKKWLPKLIDFETQPDILAPVSDQNPRISNDNSMCQRSLIVEPTASSNYIIYKLENALQIGGNQSGFITFGRF